MWYWNGDNMARCRIMLSESGKSTMSLAQECLQEAEKFTATRDDSRFLAELSEILAQTARFENLLSEGLEKIDKIYSKNEENIADCFDLAKPVAPHIEIGVSRFDSLKKHETQMPFARE